MTSEKRQDLPPGLWVVATPIGNLGDLSPRAREALVTADGLLCEDTRRTATLVNALALGRRLPELRRLDAHAGPRAIEACVERLRAGESLALVTDAGTPGISDPGAALAARAHEEGIVVTPFPGPSAPVALLSVAGFTEPEWAFLGFFPRKDGERRRALERAASAGEAGLCRVFAWFEAPSRVVDALAIVAREMPDALVFAGKEITKLHERFFRGDAADVAERVRAHVEREGAVGEWCFAIRVAAMSRVAAAIRAGASLGDPREIAAEGDEHGGEHAGRASGATDGADSSDWVKALRCLVNARVAAPEAARQVHREYGVARRDAYAVAISLAGKKNPEGD